MDLVNVSHCGTIGRGKYTEGKIVFLTGVEATMLIYVQLNVIFFIC